MCIEYIGGTHPISTQYFQTVTKKHTIIITDDLDCRWEKGHGTPSSDMTFDSRGAYMDWGIER